MQRALAAAGLLSCLLVGFTAMAQTPGATPGRSDSKLMQAHGTFEVRMAPRAAAVDGFAAMTLDKTYTGDLQASGKGEMLSAGDPKAGNAGYVAMERIAGTLAGHAGSFALMQSGIMASGTEPKMTVTIVPGSGTDELSGIYGSMTIVIAGGKHSYTVDYAFAK